MRTLPGLRFWFLGLAGLLSLVPPSSAEVTPEFIVKAAYLTKFVPFIQWPDNAFAGAGAPVTICILGDDPFGMALDRAANAPGNGARPLRVRRIAVTDTADVGALASCQIAYVSDPLVGLDVLDGVKNKPVVTVTDSGMRQHGIISFANVDNHVRFDIDNDAAEQSGLRISSKLLELARSVKMRGQP